MKIPLSHDLKVILWFYVRAFISVMAVDFMIVAFSWGDDMVNKPFPGSTALGVLLIVTSLSTGTWILWRIWQSSLRYLGDKISKW